MLFLDQENNREIYINFNFDFDSKVQTVTVNIVYHSDECSVTTYDDKFKHFIEGNDYSEFLNKYMKDPASVIDHCFIQNIKVNNSGKFLVDVYERDIHNNIFAANCDNYGNIIMPHFTLDTYTNNKANDKAEAVANPSSVTDSFIDFCIYSPTVLSNGISVDNKNGLSVKYPTYSYSMHNVSVGDHIHAINITDTYRIDAIDSITSTLSGDNTSQSLYESYNLILSDESARKFTKVLDFDDTYAAAVLNGGVFPKYNDTAVYDASKSDVLVSGKMSDYLNVFSDGELNFADVNIVFFNELTGQPLYQTYAVLANENIVDDAPYKNKFRMLVPDDSGKSYIWADLLQCTEGYAWLSLADEIERLSDTSESYRYAYYLLSRYFFDTMKDSSTSNIVSYEAVEAMSYFFNGQPYKDLVNDCCTYMSLSFDDVSTNIKKRDAKFHMLGEEKPKVTNLLYDIEAFIVESDNTLLDKVSTNFYKDLYGEDGAYFGNLIGSQSPIYKYISDLKGFDYQSCTDYYELAAKIACIVGHKCDIDSVISDKDILKSVSSLYADDFSVDELTDSIYTTFDKSGQIIIDAINENVHFDDLSKLNDSTIVDDFGKVLKSFITLQSDPANAGKEDNYYISVVYGLMVYVTLWMMNDMIVKVRKESTEYHELASPQSKKLYNRFAVYVGDSSNETSVEIIKDAYKILAAFSEVMYGSFMSETQDGPYIHVQDILAPAVFDPNVKENMSIYHKYINNLAYIKYQQMRKDNWVFSNKLTYCDNIDSITDYSNRCKFAVTVNSEGETKYYAKNAEYSDDGYLSVSESIPMTAGLSIKDLASRPYISMYVKPIWMNRINAYLLDRESAKALGLDLGYDYLCVNYKNGAFTTRFKVGEKVKLVFQPIQELSYFGQSTYEVVGYDVLKNYMILRGTINSAYINNNIEELWGYLPTYTSDNGKTRYAMIPNPKTKYPYGSIKDVKNSDKNVTEDVITDTLLTENTTYIRVHVNSSDIIIPVKYVKTSEDESGNSTGYWLYQLFAGGDNNFAPYITRINVSQVEKTNIYISYAHHSYVDYPMKAVDFNEYPDGTSEVEIEQTFKNEKYMDFIDDTFSIMSKHFDMSEGVHNWMPSTRTGNTLDSVIPEISGSAIYKYTDTPVELSQFSNNVVLDTVIDSSLMDASISYKFWRVFYNDGTNDTRLLFESYNPTLFLSSDLKGIYDVEATIYDKYGNESTHLYKGAYTVN